MDTKQDSLAGCTAAGTASLHMDFDDSIKSIWLLNYEYIIKQYKLLLDYSTTKVHVSRSLHYQMR